MENSGILTMDQAIIRARNLVVARLAAHLGIPVRLSDEQDPEAEPPYASTVSYNIIMLAVQKIA